MSDDWTPISSDELQRLIDVGVSGMSSEERNLWHAIRVTPQKWALSPWGDQGEGFWVVAVVGNRCIYYNDIEGGFNMSPFDRHGVIAEYVCNQDELHWVIRRLKASPSIDFRSVTSRRGPV